MFDSVLSSNGPCQALSVVIFDLLSLNTLGPPGAVTCPCVPWEHLLRRATDKIHCAANMTSRLYLTSNTLSHTSSNSGEVLSFCCLSEAYDCTVHTADRATSVFLCQTVGYKSWDICHIWQCRLGNQSHHVLTSSLTGKNQMAPQICPICQSWPILVAC